MGGTLPHNLGEVTPSIEVGHTGVGLAVQALEVSHLVVVHQVGDHLSNLVRGDTISNVLAIATAINGATAIVSTFHTERKVGAVLRIMLVDASSGEGLGASFQGAVPLQRAGGVVATVNVVVVQDGSLVTIRGSSAAGTGGGASQGGWLGG